MWDVGRPNLVGSVRIVLKGDVSGALHVAGVKAWWWEIEHWGLLNRLGGVKKLADGGKQIFPFLIPSGKKWENGGFA